MDSQECALSPASFLYPQASLVLYPCDKGCASLVPVSSQTFIDPKTPSRNQLRWSGQTSEFKSQLYYWPAG